MSSSQMLSSLSTAAAVCLPLTRWQPSVWHGSELCAACPTQAAVRAAGYVQDHSDSDDEDRPSKPAAPVAVAKVEAPELLPVRFLLALHSRFLLHAHSSPLRCMAAPSLLTWRALMPTPAATLGQWLIQPACKLRCGSSAAGEPASRGSGAGATGSRIGCEAHSRGRSPVSGHHHAARGRHQVRSWC